MWNLVSYILAIITGLILYFFYDDDEEQSIKQEAENQTTTSGSTKAKSDFRFSSVFAVLGLSPPGETGDEQFESFSEHFTSFDEVSEACWQAGLESSNIIIGVDFTASNEWKGRKSFNQNCLHKLMGNKVYNPYQKVIWILGQTLAPFDEDDKIPVFGFGNTETKAQSVFPFRYDGSPCVGFQEVLEWYNEVVRRVILSGPTSFAPIIRKAIDIVRDSKKYHILIVITDGQVTEEAATIDAIIDASNHPLSIITVGVGDGPWHIIERFDSQLPRRKFDNFRFVDYHKATMKSKNPDTAFALQALMEIPDQYKRIRELGYLGSVAGSDTSSHRDRSPSYSASRQASPSNSPAKKSVGSSNSPSASARTRLLFRHRLSNVSC